MNGPKRLLWLPVILFAVLLRVEARENAPSQPPPTFRMELVYIFDADSPEFIFVIGNTGFKSVASLKRFLSSLPPGSTLEWDPGCLRMGNEPLLSSKQEMEEFKAFCAESKIKFVLLPAG